MGAGMLQRKRLSTVGAVKRPPNEAEPVSVETSCQSGQVPVSGWVIAPDRTAPAESHPVGPADISVLRRRATAGATIRRKVEGKVKIKSPEGDFDRSFGDWLYTQIAELAEDQEWAFNVEGSMGYVWPREQEVTRKGHRLLPAQGASSPDQQGRRSDRRLHLRRCRSGEPDGKEGQAGRAEEVGQDKNSTRVGTPTRTSTIFRYGRSPTRSPESRTGCVRWPG